MAEVEEVPVPDGPGVPLELQAQRWDAYRPDMLADMLGYELEMWLYRLNALDRAALLKQVSQPKRKAAAAPSKDAGTTPAGKSPKGEARKPKRSPKAKAKPAASGAPLARGTCRDCGSAMTKWIPPGISRSGVPYGAFYGCPKWPHKT